MIDPKKLGKASMALGLSVLMLGTNVANAESYKLEKPINVYSTAYDSMLKKNPVTTFSPGIYNVFRRFQGQINITKTSGPGGWINPSDTTPSSPVKKPVSTQVKKSYKSTDYVYVRTGPGTNYKDLGLLANGTVVTGVKVGDWLKITYKGRTAYTKAEYYDEISSNKESNQPQTVKQTYKNYYAKTGVYVRTGKGTNYSKLGINYKGTKIYATLEGAWLKFTYNGKTAYTAAEFYSQTAPSNTQLSIANAKEFIADTGVYFRSGKGTNYSKLGINYKGDVIKGVVEGPWIKFVYNNKFAYTAAAYYTQKGTTKQKEKVEVESADKENYIAQISVYARSSKSSDAKTKIGVVSKGEIINGVIDGAWIRFTMDGKTAYTAKAYYKKISQKQTPLNQNELSYMADYAVYVRSDASTDSQEMGLIPKGSTIRGVKEGDWIRFTYNDRQCYTAAQFYTPLSIPETSYNNISKEQAYINRIAPTAKILAKGNDLYASVMIAQSILETGYGTSWLASSDINNLFGIKGHYNGQYAVLDAFEYAGTRRYYELSHFKKYPSIAESMMDYVSLLTGNHDPRRWNYKYYLGVRRSQTTSYKDATRALTGTYATAPNYYISLDNLIEQYNLTQYD